MIRIGTAHFVNRAAAERYYRPYGYDDVAETVSRKLADGEIFIGTPTLLPGQRLVVIDDGTRYATEEAEAEPHPMAKVRAETARFMAMKGKP